MTNSVFIRGNGNKVTTSVTNQNNNTGIICDVNYGNICQNGIEVNEYKSVSPFGHGMIIETPRVFNWKGKSYKDSIYLNEGFVSTGLDEIKKAWKSHCFSDFLESLRKFDEMMKLLTSEQEKTRKKILYVEEAFGNADSITIFLGKLFENFEGVYTKKTPMISSQPFFVDYVVNNGSVDESWLVGYDTEVLDNEYLFKNGIYQFANGDLHEVLDTMEDWWLHFHHELMENTNQKAYKAIPLNKVSTMSSKLFIDIINDVNSKKKHKKNKYKY